MADIQTQLDRIEAKLDIFIERLVKVETNQQNARSLVGWIAGIVAALVTAILTGIAAAFGRQ